MKSGPPLKGRLASGGDGSSGENQICGRSARSLVIGGAEGLGLAVGIGVEGGAEGGALVGDGAAEAQAARAMSTTAVPVARSA
jgi:hypothetical protein